jgi:hypothetical protein
MGRLLVHLSLVSGPDPNDLTHADKENNMIPELKNFLLHGVS